MPVASYFPPSHEREPPTPVSPSSPSTRSTRRRSSCSPPLAVSVTPPTLSRSTSAQLPSPSAEARRRSSALTALDDDAIKLLSKRARDAERRAQWEGTKLLNLEPPSTPPRTRLASASSSLYQTPDSTSPYPPRSPRSPRSTEPSTMYATSIRSSASSTRSHLSAVSEFLAQEDPPPPRVRTSTTRSTTSSSSARLRQPRSRAPSDRVSAVFPSSSSSTTHEPPNVVSPRSSFDSSSSSSSEEEEEGGGGGDYDGDGEEPMRFAPRLVKPTTEPDQFVQLLDRERQAVLDQRQRLRDERERRARARTESSTGSATGQAGTDHSRSESGNSDASFASMTATGPSPVVRVEREVTIREEEELTDMLGRAMSAPGMERDDTLKPPTISSSSSSSGNRWDSLEENGSRGGGGGGVKSIEDIVRGYKALGIGNEVKGIVERRRSSVATIQLPPRRDASLDEYQYPTPVSPAFDTFRPLSPNSTSSSSEHSSSNLLPYVPFPGLSSPITEAPGKIKSIDEIIAQHAGPSYLAAKNSPTSTPSSTPIAASFTTSRTRELSHISSTSERSTRDSIGREVRQSATGASSFLKNSLDPGRPKSEAADRETPALAFDPSPARTETRGSNHSSIRSLSVRSPSPRSSSPNPRADSPLSITTTTTLPSPSTSSASHELSALLRSPRLTRLVALSRPCNANLTVSLADVGSPTGHPVVVFLGLGAVRYMLALYDELAQVFNLRLVCLDRWGLGKTSTVPDRERGFDEWSRVVDEVVEDHLGLARGAGGYSILAHSAGAPYAVAHAVASRNNVTGTVHLLAPWVIASGGANAAGQNVGMSADNLAGMYKYLKYVPSGVLKTAQTAEWKIQGWRLGKAPVEESSPRNGRDDENADDVDDVNEAREKIGQHTRPLVDGYVTPKKEKRESLASLGIGGGGEVVDKLERLYPDGGIRLAGPQAVHTPGKGGNSTPRRKASLSVSGKSFFGNILGGSAKSNRSISSAGDDSSASLRPSVASNGRRSSYFAASAIDNSRSTSSPLSAETRARPSGLTGPATPTPTSSSNRASFLPDHSPSPGPALAHGTPRHPRPSSSSRTNSTEGFLSPTSPPASTSSSSSTPSRTTSSISPTQLISGLLRASHAESLPGSTSDLLVLLDRTHASSKGGATAATASGSQQQQQQQQQQKSLRYRDVDKPVRVWYGDRDDRISEASVKWLEREIPNCTVQVVSGADHNLMTNHRVMFEVLESISREFEANSQVALPSRVDTRVRD